MIKINKTSVELHCTRGPHSPIDQKSVPVNHKPLLAVYPQTSRRSIPRTESSTEVITEAMLPA